ncbi:MAG: SoxR reducing system RseC family protein [Thermodesulfobacteriota bacterium]|nr:SoxR reducing system RseC family protein [Thermodesulfobacteriota bacterium]
MATEEGTVLRTSPDSATAWVRTVRSAACEHCHSRESCRTLGGNNDMEVESINQAGAKAGDLVVINFSTVSLLKATFLIYMFPIICLMLGAAAGYKLSARIAVDESLLSGLMGFGAFVLSILFVRVRGNSMARSAAYQPKIIRIKKPGPPTDQI